MTRRPPRFPRGGALLIAFVVTAGILNYADRQIVAVLKPLLERDLKWSDADYGHIASVFQIASAFALLGTGWLVDRVGWRRANPLAVGVWSVVAMTQAAARTAGAFTAARAALGAAEALATPTAIKTIAAVYPQEQRSFVLGLMNGSNTLGAVATPIAIPALALAFGWSNAFLLTGGAGLVWVLAWALSGVSRAETLGEPAAAPVREPGAFLKALRARSTWAFAGGKLLSDQVWWLLLAFTPDILHRLFRLDVAATGAYTSGVYALAAVGSVAAGWLASALLTRGWSVNRTRKSVLLGLALLATPIALTPWAPTPLAATALIGLTLAAHQGFSVNIFALATDIAPETRVGSVISLGAFCGNVAGALILEAAGRLLAAGLGYGALLGYAAVSYLLAVGWIQLLLPQIPARPPEAAGPAEAG